MFFVFISILAASCIAKIQINSPVELRDKFKNGEILTGFADFGFVPYGIQINGRLYFSPENEYGCNKSLSFFSELVESEDEV
jgi:hypothetical protein